VSRNIKLLMQL